MDQPTLALLEWAQAHQGVRGGPRSLGRHENGKGALGLGGRG